MFASKKRKWIAVAVIIVVLLLLLLLPFKIPYVIHANGIVLPIKEWTLGRTSDGNLISSQRDNKTGFLNSYTINEFQRGDDAKFVFNSAILNQQYIKKGDTIGRIHSNEEEIRLLQLKGELEIQKSQLQIYKTGLKPEDIQAYANKLELAKQELETQKKLTSRTTNLYNDSLVSQQIYEIALNELRVKELNVKIAESNYYSASTGAKPEQAGLIQSKILAIEDQIKKLSSRINHFTITAPFSGTIVQRKSLYNQFSSYQSGFNNSSFDVIVEVADTSGYVVIMPVEFLQKEYIKPGLTVSLKIRDNGHAVTGKILMVDNVIQIVNGKQVVFVTAIFDQIPFKLLPGIFTDAAIIAEPITIRDHLLRTIQLIF